MQLGYLLVQLVQRPGDVRPVEPVTGGLALELLRPPQSRQAPGHGIQRLSGGLLALLPALDGLPALQHRIGVLHRLLSPEHMGMPEEHLANLTVGHIVHGEIAGLPLDVGMEYHLQQQIPQLLLQQGRVLPVDGLGGLIGFLQQTAPQGGMGLHSIPRTAVLRPQQRHDAQQIAPIARLFVICERSLKKSRWFSPLFGGKNGTQLLSAHCPQQQDETAVHRSGCRYGSQHGQRQGSPVYQHPVKAGGRHRHGPHCHQRPERNAPAKDYPSGASHRQ